MLRKHLYVLFCALLAQPVVEGADSQTYLMPGLGPGLGKKENVQGILERTPVTEPSCEQFPTGPIETTSCDFETVESVTEGLYTDLHDLVVTPFFKFFRADLYRECPFWQENGFCMNRECAITTVDESEIPENWRAAALSKVEITSKDQLHRLPGCYYRDSDFCFTDDMTEGDYIDLSLNPERFTGYTGPSAHRVWKSIYEENCFGISEFDTLGAFSKADGQAVGPSASVCLEQRVYHKIISGLHASISTHICNEDFNQTTGEWGPNLQCFINRIATYPERLENIYFNTVLLLRAVARIGPYLSAYDYCGDGTHQNDAYTLEKLNSVIGTAKTVGRFDETVLFRGDNANILKEEFKQHFRNVSRIMDCVGCDKCRLWGKIQTSGVGTALKILFELDETALDPKINQALLSRSEVVALINTLHRFTESLHAVNNFRVLWQEAEKSKQEVLLDETVSEDAPKPRHSPPSDRDMFAGGLVSEIQRLMRICKDGTMECVRGLVVGLTSVVSAVSGLFKLSGKSDVPHSEL
ncbi:endoplasmic oxidoreductin [Cytidiella melzeri]|nr:endoplasmic oxidoreductin [Cytidiella melzeri]